MTEMTDAPTTDAPATPVPAVSTKAILVFVALALGLAWLVALPMWFLGGLTSPIAGTLVQLMMFTPAIATLVVLLALRAVPPAQQMRYLGIWPLRPVKRLVGMSLLGLFGPVVVIALSVGIAAAVGWVELDLVGFSGFVAATGGALPDGIPTGLIIALQFLAIPFAAASVNAVLALGEEIGWRGFLQPALQQRIGTWPALLVTGVIWGVWHAPVILLGYNFERTDITGVLLMVAGSVMWGVLLGWLRMRSASLWPAVFAHGAINASGAMVLLFHAAGTPVDMALVGPLGAAGWIACALAIVVLLATGQFRRR